MILLELRCYEVPVQGTHQVSQLVGPGPLGTTQSETSSAKLNLEPYVEDVPGGWEMFSKWAITYLEMGYIGL